MLTEAGIVQHMGAVYRSQRVTAEGVLSGDFMFRKQLRDAVREIHQRCWETDHVWNPVRYRVHVIAIWADHLSLLYVNLVDVVRK
jgi:hypothetical protein